MKWQRQESGDLFQTTWSPKALEEPDQQSRTLAPGGVAGQEEGSDQAPHCQCPAGLAAHPGAPCEPIRSWVMLGSFTLRVIAVGKVTGTPKAAFFFF